MQISTLANAVSPTYGNQVYSQSTSGKLSRTSATADISYQNQGDSVQLSLTGRIEYEEVTYSAEGTLSQTAPVEEESGTEESNLAENLYNRYLEIIRKRIEYLLQEIFGQGKNGDSSSFSKIYSIDQAAYESLSSSESMYSVSGEMSIDATIAVPDAYSPENTAKRIVSFALSFYDGGDREAYASMAKEAVMKGYLEAREALGGFLPSEADQTISLVMEALDNFASGNSLDMTA
ncbi:DUF5610 domain-containing protein [bacterium]|nr:DUF5610 domain-containing protein [bacterium]